MTDTTPTGEPVEPTPAMPDTTPVPPPPSVPVPTTGDWGPPGKIRSWGAVAVFWIITCGIYGLVWQYKVFEENKKASGEGVGGVVGLVIGLLVGIVNLFLLPTEIKNIYEKAGQESPVRWTVALWNLIPLVGFFIWVYKVQTAMNTRWEQMGAVRA